MKIFVDCDVLLDVALGREPFREASGELLDYLESNVGLGFMAWHSIANLFYIVSKVMGKVAAKTFIVQLCQFIQVVPTGTHEVLQAANLAMNDFEDALQCVAAMTSEAEVIATRNVQDYRNSPIEAVTPEEILSRLNINHV